ncbi:MAG TPA: LLM class flavin-dependent oxidoreductase [Nevskiaceae bacterium]|nr:LLM class flavin-dependent oxidoreductase [Nevskiaceae bacterium]
MSDVRTGIGLWVSRHFSPKVALAQARAMEASGHIDQFVLWDQLTSWWPQALWEPSITPLAGMMPDVDSSPDPFTASAFALSAAEKLGFAICTDALRRDPPEMAQTLLTLALATEGRATLCLGAGEVRHIGPFGRNRAIGLKRLEDALQIMQLLLKGDRLVNFDGKVWQLRDAWLGNGGKQKRPEILAMGGGPRLTEMAVKYADGFSSGAPFVYASAEKYAETVRSIRQQLKDIGRGNDPYTFGLHHIVFLCRSKDDFEQYVDHPLLKWYAATGGRINMNDWAPEGIEPVMPLDWHYAFDMRPSGMTRAQVDEVISKVKPEMVRKTFFYGSPADIAEQVRPYVKAGATLNLLADLSPLMVPTDPVAAIEQMAELCRLVKAP